MTNSTFDVAEIADDLDFETASKFAPAPATSPTSAPAAAVPATSAQIKTLNWGTAVALPTGDSLTRLKVESKHESLRFALLPGLEAFSVQGHYLALSGKDPRMWLCTGTPACPGCRSGNRGKWSTVAFAVAYENADRTTGRLATDATPEYQVGFVYLGHKNFNEILKRVPAGSKPWDVDWCMTIDDLKHYRFEVVANKARHIARNDTAALLAQVEPLLPLLAGKLGSPFPPNTTVSTAPPVAEGMAD
jgi:hypothetical protein